MTLVIFLIYKLNYRQVFEVRLGNLSKGSGRRGI